MNTITDIESEFEEKNTEPDAESINSMCDSASSINSDTALATKSNSASETRADTGTASQSITANCNTGIFCPGNNIQHNNNITLTYRSTDDCNGYGSGPKAAL